MAIAEPSCPDSMTKFLLDVFYDTSTSSIFYTTDMMVLIDIVTRQLTDLSQGDEVSVCTCMCMVWCDVVCVCVC